MNTIIYRLLTLFCRLWPLNRGHYALTQNPIVSWIVSKAPQDIEAKLRSGLFISTNLSDYNGRMVGLFGIVEPTITKICRTLLRKDWCFLDIGANYGAVGLNCYDILGAGGQVHFFEPQEDLCERIQACIESAGLPWLFVHAVGVLDRDGTLLLRKPPGHTGGASFFNGDGAHATETEVPIRSYSSYVLPLISGRRFAAKIDVEGSESIILQQVLQSTGLGFAVFECNRAHERELIWNIVEQNECLLFGIPNLLFRVELRRIFRLSHMQEYSDFLSIKASELNSDANKGILSPSELSRLVRY